jgi:L-ribulose-5-phosphate 3-epimerase
MQSFRIGAVTDIFSPDVTAAAAAMRKLGMNGAELRTINGRSVLEAADEEVDCAIRALRDNDLEIVAIASPLLKCTVAEWAAQSRMAERVFEIAVRAGASIVRVFSGARVADPRQNFEHLVDLLQDLADRAAKYGLTIGLENDRSCNVATAQELASVLAAIDHSNLQVVWDPGSAYVSGETPFPSGYQMLDLRRIAHVHAKDCTLEGHKPVWAPLGEGDIDWQGQIDALANDGYEGCIHLETYWAGILDCVRNLKRMAASAYTSPQAVPRPSLE